MIDILFLAHKRPEFTRESWRALLLSGAISGDNQGGRIGVYTDGEPALPHFQKWARTERFGGPVACLNAFLDETAPNPANDPDGNPQRAPEATPEFIAKIDNDTIVPPGWLPACLDLMRRYPNVDLLGIEPWTPDEKLFPRWVEPDGATFPELMKERPVLSAGWHIHRPRPVSHIGGIGVFRRSAFERFGRPVPNSQDGRYGFTEWQWANAGMVKAFIDPPLPVFLLDHLPFAPWWGFSNRYELERVQRNVGWKYDRVKHKALWDWWLASGESLESRSDSVGGPRL